MAAWSAERQTERLRLATIPIAGATDGEVIGFGARSTAIRFGTTNNVAMVDVMLVDSPSVKLSGLVKTAKILSDTDDQISRTFGQLSAGANYFVGEGIDGPSIHKVRPYVEGDTLQELSLRQAFSNKNTIRDVAAILSQSERHFLRTGLLPDITGCLNIESIWLRRISCRVPLKSSNIVVNNRSGHAVLIDCEADPLVFSLKDKSVKRTLSIISLFVGYKVTEIVLKSVLFIREAREFVGDLFLKLQKQSFLQGRHGQAKSGTEIRA